MTTPKIPFVRNITQDMIDNFVPSYLYVKRHTDLYYFGKTIKNPEKYNGSGTHWSRHIKKYGKDKIETLWYMHFDDIFELHNTALHLSKLFNIVESTEWANMIPENGLDTGFPTKNTIWVHNKEGKNARVNPNNIPDGYIIGMHTSAESSKKRSDSHLGKRNSPESIAKSTAYLKGRKKTPEHVDKVRQAHLGKKKSPEHCKNVSLGLTGLKQTKSHIEARSGTNHKTFSGYYVTPHIFTAFRAKLYKLGIRSQWCKDANKIISKSSYNRSEYLHTNYAFDELIGKTYKEIGFYFIKSDEYVSGCTDVLGEINDNT